MSEIDQVRAMLLSSDREINELAVGMLLSNKNITDDYLIELFNMRDGLYQTPLYTNFISVLEIGLSYERWQFFLNVMRVEKIIHPPES